jgi:putative ABC transport system permease protein
MYGPVEMTTPGHQWNTYIDGTTSDFPSMRGYHLAEGSFFTLDLYAASARVVVLGPTPAHHLFPDSDPLGQQVRMNNVPFTVIGVYASKGGSSLTNDDDTATVPYTTARASLFGPDQSLAILVDARSKAVVDLTVAEVRSVLEARHDITDPAKDDFNISTTSNFISLANQFTGIFTIVIAAIAAISLLVGGIGIMNILLVSVTERTREIGIRKAVGARRADIVQQFLLESVMLSLLGGVVGVVLGGSISQLIGLFAPLKPVVSVTSVLLAFGVSVAVGLFFGVWPASRAARLRPVEALRHE